MKKKKLWIMIIGILLTALLMWVILFDWGTYFEEKRLTKEVPSSLSNRIEGKKVVLHTDLTENQRKRSEKIINDFIDHINSRFFPINLDNDRLHIALYSSSSEFQKRFGVDKSSLYDEKNNILHIDKISAYYNILPSIADYFYKQSAVYEFSHRFDKEILTDFFRTTSGYLTEHDTVFKVGFRDEKKFLSVLPKISNYKLENLFDNETYDRDIAHTFIRFLYEKEYLSVYLLERINTPTHPFGILEKISGQSLEQIEEEWKEWVENSPRLRDQGFISTIFFNKEKYEKWYNDFIVTDVGANIYSKIAGKELGLEGDKAKRFWITSLDSTIKVYEHDHRWSKIILLDNYDDYDHDVTIGITHEDKVVFYTHYPENTFFNYAVIVREKNNSVDTKIELEEYLKERKAALAKDFDYKLLEKGTLENFFSKETIPYALFRVNENFSIFISFFQDANGNIIILRAMVSTDSDYFKYYKEISRYLLYDFEGSKIEKNNAFNFNL